MYFQHELASFSDLAMEVGVDPSWSRLGFAPRNQLEDWNHQPVPSLEGQVVVLTSFTPGIGLAAATLLGELGCSIMRPEHLPIGQQVELLASGSHAAGIEGSVSHGLVLVKGIGGAIYIVRRRTSPNFDLLASVGGWDQRWTNAVGARRHETLTVNNITGARIPDCTIDGINTAATALAIDCSSRRKTRGRPRNCKGVAATSPYRELPIGEYR
jgi:hypothetical protein